jgi:GT2 family glycosyltransferase
MLGFRVIFIPSAVFYHMESYTLGSRMLLQVPHKLYLVLTGMFAYIISLYDNPLWLTASTSAYMVALALMLMYSIIMRTKFLVWVIIKTLSLNMKMLDVLLHRRTRIIGMRKFSINKVLRYTKSINKYISFAHALANIAFKKDIF